MREQHRCQHYHRDGMESPEQVPGSGGSAPSLRLGGAGHLDVSPDFAARADERFAAVCGELGIPLARRVEPVAARVLPFGSEQVAMVRRLDAPESAPQHRSGLGMDTMTGGRSVLASALPSAIAEGKVRTAVVFGDGEAPVRWGEAGDEARLAALYAVVPHLGSITATTGTDTYRVLRLPGIGVALVSDGASAATWVEGWFAALVHATQFAMRMAQASSTTLTATPPPQPDAEGRGQRPSLILEQLEDECRRILTAAQDQARAIRENAELEVARAAVKTAPPMPLTDEGAERDSARATVKTAPPTPPTKEDAESPRRTSDDDDRARLLEVSRREIDRLLGDAERARAAVLAEAQRDADAVRRAAEQSSAALQAGAERQCGAMLKKARRDAKSMRRDAKRLRKDASRVRSRARDDRRARDANALKRDGRVLADVIGDARRTADDLLHDARRAADDLLHDAARTRQRMLDESVQTATSAPVAAPVAIPVAAQVDATTATRADAPPPVASSEEARIAALALLAAAAESLAAMSSVLIGVATERGGAAPGDPFKDLPGLYFGA